MRDLADHLERRVPGFDRSGFVEPVVSRLDDLEFKERAQLIADHVHGVLPPDHAERARILRALLHPDDEGRTDLPGDERGLSGWIILPLTLVVGQHGVDDFERSLDLLQEMTQRSSSEFGIRYFLLADLERVLATIKNWVRHPSHHVRRLVSEGTRPRLPWAMQLPRLRADPSPMLPILEALRDDPSDYVRRSVANHLNDIAKDHLDLVARLAREWMRDAGSARKNLLRHACRTLTKNGHEGAPRALGFEAPSGDGVRRQSAHSALRAIVHVRCPDRFDE